MATIRLVPSVIAVSNASYVSYSDESNMFTNTDSTTSGTITHNRASTNSTYYAYLRGFNFSSMPSGAEVSSFTVKIKASATGHTTSTSTSYQMSLVNGTTQIGSTYASGRLSTTTTTFTFSNGSLTWETIVGYGTNGANFGIRIPLRRASSNTADVVTVYGAEIEVTYTIPTPRTITSTLSGSGTIVPSGAQTYYDGNTYEIVITPTNSSDTVTATLNGTDITSQLVEQIGGTEEKVLGTYALVSGSFNGSGATYFQGLVGKGYNNTQTTSNYYSSGSSTIAVFTYDMSISIPSDATVTACYVMVNGHAESTSQSNEYMCAQLLAGSTAITSELNFKSIGTSNSTQTLQATTLPTPAQCATLKLQCRLGYYGGAINGATLFLEYSVNSKSYKYSYTVNGDATIAIVIGGGGGSTPKIYIKKNGTWTQCSKVYKKINGSWVEQASSTWTTILPTTDDYRLIEV